MAGADGLPSPSVQLECLTEIRYAPHSKVSQIELGTTHGATTSAKSLVAPPVIIEMLETANSLNDLIFVSNSKQKAFSLNVFNLAITREIHIHTCIIDHTSNAITCSRYNFGCQQEK